MHATTTDLVIDLTPEAHDLDVLTLVCRRCRRTMLEIARGGLACAARTPAEEPADEAAVVEGVRRG